MSLEPLKAGQRRYVIVVTSEIDALDTLEQTGNLLGASSALQATVRDVTRDDALLRTLLSVAAETEADRALAREKSEHPSERLKVGDVIEWWCPPLAERTAGERPDGRRKGQTPGERGQHFPDLPEPCPGGVWHEGVIQKCLVPDAAQGWPWFLVSGSGGWWGWEMDGSGNSRRWRIPEGK